jgi:hypothetical protein
MSEYEMLDAMIGAFGLGISAIVFYFTVLSSYLIVAHFAGAKLAGFQIAIITGLFILAALFGVWSSTSFLVAGRELQQLQTILPMYSPYISPHQLVAPLQLLGILASLKFMWDIRHPKID